MADPTSKRELVIFGAGGHATSVANVAISAGFAIACFIDGRRQGARLLGADIIGDEAALGDQSRFSLAIAAGDNCLRERIYRELTARTADLHFPALVHASAVLSTGAELGAGTVVMPGAVVGPNATLGRFCIVNTRSSLDHDCRMGDFASLAPGAITGGDVRVGTRAAISIGAVVKHGLDIGDDSVLGANSYLNKDLPANTLAYGNPARIIRSRAAGDPYLG